MSFLFALLVGGIDTIQHLLNMRLFQSNCETILRRLVKLEIIPINFSFKINRSYDFTKIDLFIYFQN